MADGVPISAGSGTTIATDDVSSVHYQQVKLVDGTLNSTAVIAGDATNGLDVDVTRMPRSATPAQSSVAGNASSVSLLASNSARMGATIFNDSSAILYLKLGATASTTSFTTKINPGGYYEVPFNYTGAIDGIWDVATGNARITELEA